MVDTTNLKTQTETKIAGLVGTETDAELLALSATANSVGAVRTNLDTIIQNRITALAGAEPNKHLLALAKSSEGKASFGVKPSALLLKSTTHTDNLNGFDLGGFKYASLVPNATPTSILTVNGTGIFRFSMLYRTGDSNSVNISKLRVLCDGKTILDTSTNASIVQGRVIVGNLNYTKGGVAYLSTDALAFSNNWTIELTGNPSNTFPVTLAYDYTLTE